MPPPNPLSQIFQHIQNDQLDAALKLLKSGKLTNRQKRLVKEYAQQLESLSKRLQRLTLSPDEYLKEKHVLGAAIKDLAEEVFPAPEVTALRKVRRTRLVALAVVLAAVALLGGVYYYNTRPPEPVRVLILPFNPIKNCTIEETSYEQQIINRYEKIIKEDTLNLVIEKRSGQCVQSEDEARSLGADKGVDMVIWGDYNEDCDKDGYELAIKYSVVNKINKLCFLKEFGDTKIQKLESIYDLGNGALQEEVDRVVYSFLITKVMMEEAGPIPNMLKAANLFRKYLKRFGKCQESMMTEFLLCAYGPFAKEVDELVKNGGNKLPFNLIIQTEGIIYVMLLDYLKICPNSENSIQIFTTTATTLLSIKGLTNDVSQNYYFAAKTALLSIKNETNQSVIDEELFRLETAFLSRTQPSIRPATKLK